MLFRTVNVSKTAAAPVYDCRKGMILDILQIFINQKNTPMCLFLRGGSTRLLQLLKTAIGRHELWSHYFHVKRRTKHVPVDPYPNNYLPVTRAN